MVIAYIAGAIAALVAVDLVAGLLGVGLAHYFRQHLKVRAEETKND